MTFLEVVEALENLPPNKFIGTNHIRNVLSGHYETPKYLHDQVVTERQIFEMHLERNQ